jgi:preprotein translocase subunit YajC
MHRTLLLLSTAALAMAESEPGAAPAPAPAPTGTTAPAPGGNQPAGQQPAMGMQWIIFPMILALIYFMMIRPQRRDEAKRRELTNSLKRGDRVVTIGGLHGEIAAVGEKTIDLKVGQDGRETILTFNKGAVSSNAADAEAVKK